MQMKQNMATGTVMLKIVMERGEECYNKSKRRRCGGYERYFY